MVIQKLCTIEQYPGSVSYRSQRGRVISSPKRQSLDPMILTRIDIRRNINSHVLSYMNINILT